jgi:nitrogen regulatory protein P-II 2
LTRELSSALSAPEEASGKGRYAMKAATANIRIQLSQLDEGQSLLTALGVQSITVNWVRERGYQKSPTEIYRGTEYSLGFVPHASAQADKVMAAIQETARTGRLGDGEILFSPIERAVRMRIGETDKPAVQTFTDIFDEEVDNGIRDIRAPKTRVVRGCSLGHRDSLSCIW